MNWMSICAFHNKIKDAWYGTMLQSCALGDNIPIDLYGY